MKRGRGLLVTDLDGTLLGGDRRLRDCDRAALARLGREGCLRAIATGRHLHSFGMVERERFPVDYVVCLLRGGDLRPAPSPAGLRSRSLTANGDGGGGPGAGRTLTSTSWCTGRSRTTITSSTGGRAGRTSTSKGAWSGIARSRRRSTAQLGPSAQLLAVVPADRSEPSSDDVANSAAGSHRDQGHLSSGPSFDLDRGVPARGVEEPGGGLAGRSPRHPPRRRLRGRQRLQRSAICWSGPVPATWSPTRRPNCVPATTWSRPAGTAASRRRPTGGGVR